MKRRDMLKTTLAAGLTGLTPEIGAGMSNSINAEANHYYELRTYDLRNDLHPARANDYFEKHLIPALKRAGVGTIGAFSVVSGQRTPALVLLLDYASLAVAQTVAGKLATDQDYLTAARTFEKSGQLPYVRYESSLLRAFDGHPKPEIPASEARRPGRLFELRTYESATPTSLRSKIDMFNQEEIKIFRDCGFANIFFGEMVIGPRMPNLTYLIGFDDMAAREKAWDTFRVNPDWLRIKGRPEWADAEVVSNITASYLRPTSFSQIR
jgi:hypothetical protein